MIWYLWINNCQLPGMTKSKSEKASGRAMNKRPTTDQNNGPQQLYEDRKLGHPDLRDAITADLKQVRKNASKKMNRRLLNRRKPKSSK